jgi:hypothetical protein
MFGSKRQRLEVESLIVDNNASVGGNLQVVGSETVSSLASSGDITYPRYDIIVQATGQQLIPDSTPTSVSFTSKVAGSNITFSNPQSQFTIPIAGWYQFNFSVSFTSDTTGRRYIGLQDITSGLWWGVLEMNACLTDTTRMSSSAKAYMAANDAVELVVIQGSGGPLYIGGDSYCNSTLAIDRLHE